jgi:hypothetical protein
MLLCIVFVDAEDDYDCNSIFCVFITQAMNNILATSLSSTAEVKMPHNHKNYLSLLLEVPTLSVDILEPFLTSNLVTTLTYKPHVDVYTAISKQDDWTHKKSPAILTSIIGSVS